MKYKLILGAAALSLLLPGIAYSQQEQEKEKSQQEEKKQQQESEKQKQEAGKQQQHEEKQQGQMDKERRQQSEQGKKQTEVQRTEQRSEQREANHEHGRIPDDRFRASFGHEHVFRVERRDDRRFQYGGFWFSYAQVWPVGWAYSDDVYVDFIDGQYYLIDLRHPGVRLLLIVE